MKKIYTLLTMLVVASASFAQSFTVKVGDKVVADGEKVEINLQEMPVQWIVPGVIGIYSLDPEIKIEADADQTIKITTSDDIKDGILQNCAFDNCVPVTATNCPVSAEGTIKKGETDAAIHLTYGSNNPGADFQRAFDVIISNGSKTVSFSVQFNVGSYAAASVAGIPMNGSASSIYTLGGVKVADNAQQSGKIYIKGGKKYVK